jgi:hypothetical protein
MVITGEQNPVLHWTWSWVVIASEGQVMRIGGNGGAAPLCFIGGGPLTSNHW